MKLFAFGVLASSVAVGALLLLVPGAVNTPGCAQKIAVSSAYASQMASANAELFRLDTLPLLTTIVGGYVVFGAVAIGLVRRGRRQGW